MIHGDGSASQITVDRADARRGRRTLCPGILKVVDVDVLGTGVRRRRNRRIMVMPELAERNQETGDEGDGRPGRDHILDATTDW